MFAPHAKWKPGTKALRFVTSAHIPKGKLHWKRGLVSARNPVSLAAGLGYCSTAGCYRQARCNSQNLLSVASNFSKVNRNPMAPDKPAAIHNLGHNTTPDFR